MGPLCITVVIIRRLTIIILPLLLLLHIVIIPLRPLLVIMRMVTQYGYQAIGRKDRGQMGLLKKSGFQATGDVVLNYMEE